MNIPVYLKNTNFENSLNMLWEWKWLPDGNPSDHRLQAYWSLFKYENSY